MEALSLNLIIAWWGFSRNVCLALCFKVAVVATVGKLDIRRSLVSRDVALHSIIIDSLTLLCLQRGWVRGIHGIGWHETEPLHFSWGNAREISVCSQLDERLNTELLRHSIDT